MNAAEVERAMLALNRRDLAALVHRGIQALDHGDIEASQDEVDAAWRIELERRVDDIQNGKVETVPLDESFARARSAVAEIRKQYALVAHRISSMAARKVLPRDWRSSRMTDSTQPRAWPLYVVPDVITGDQVLLGRIVYNGNWRLEHEDLSLVDNLPHSTQLRTLAEGWLEELAREVRTANGSDEGAEPLSVSRMEWRRVFHNNHLRIGPSEPRSMAEALSIDSPDTSDFEPGRLNFTAQIPEL